MDKTKRKPQRDGRASQTLADEVSKATQNPGTPGRDARVWVRDDGAVCFGDECVVVKPDADGALNLTVNPDACGQQAGEAILTHLIRTAGKGVRIHIPAAEVNTDKK